MCAETRQVSGNVRLVVGIGASAGGLEACKRFLAAMPPDSGMAFVIVMHLDPNRESQMANILQNSTTMSVIQVVEEQTLEPNCVYMIAPDTLLKLQQGVLTLESPRDQHGQRRRDPIDVFFAALADDQGERAVAIVMSGTGQNGAAGIQHIKAKEGLCLVQSPETAEFTGMPRSAIATGVVDEVLSPEQIPKILLAYAKHLHLPHPSPAEEREEEAPITLDDILDLLGQTYGVNFRTSYKRGTLERRTNRRMSLKQTSDWQEYLKILESDPKEVTALYHDLLIGVTQFFRDPEIWQHLEEEIIPKLLRQHQEDLPLRIWVPGCATGEEAYSLAIVFLEQLQRLNRTTQLQIFATDVAENALAFARQGLYPASIDDSVSPERLSRFFHPEGEKFEINHNIRDVVTFAKHNLLADPPFSKLNLVSCRNVLIYLESHVQQRILELFHFALKPDGLLLLGASETVGRHGKLFETVSQTARIFRATGEVGRYQYIHRTSERTPSRSYTALSTPVPKGPSTNRRIEQFVLSRYTWACVAVTESLEIQSFFGPTNDYLLQPTGKVRLDLPAWARPGIYPRLRIAFEQARKQNKPVKINDMRVERGDHTVRVEGMIEPIIPLPGESRMFLVSFRDVPETWGAESQQSVESEEPLVRLLEDELKRTREELQGTVEQLGSANEEYRASHEELLSLNEELQSNNEELEASKEELQSLNEEMLTVNQQLEAKNHELRAVSADLNNLLVSTNIPIIFLDRQLRIRRFTPATTELMRLVSSDVGRSIEHVKERFHDECLLDDAKKVLDKLIPISAEVETEDGRFFTRSILPYRTEDDRIDGVCITFRDITARRLAALRSEEARLYAEAIVATVQTSLVVLDADLRVVTANGSFYQAFHLSRAETEGQHFYELGRGQWDMPELHQLLDNILPTESQVQGYEVELDLPHIGHRVMRLNARQLGFAKRPLLLLAIEDVTEDVSEIKAAKERADARAKELAQEHKRKDEFLAMLGHELRNPLSALIQGIELLKLRRDKPERINQLHEMMMRQANRIRSMLDQLLDIARLTTGKISIAQQPVDLKGAIQAAVEAVMPQIKEREQEFSMSLPEESIFVQGDWARLAQVMENLLANAARYSNDGGAIALSLTADSDWVQIRVRDNGIGIEPELLPHIFEPFTQGPRTPERAAGGLGLGLPLVKYIVDLHRGRVKVASRPELDQGSEFVVTLPRLHRQQTAEDTKEPHAQNASKSPSCRILLVDDEEDSVHALAEILQSQGYTCDVIHDGPGVLEAVHSFQPDVVLLDIGLPGMDGYQVARRLREEYSKKHLMLVALTGYQKDDQRLQEAGFDHHLLKPPDVEKLLTWLNQRSQSLTSYQA